MFLLLLLLATSSVSSAPFFADRGAGFSSLGVSHGRPRVTSSVFGDHKVQPWAFLNNPFIRRDPINAYKPVFQGKTSVPAKDHMEEAVAARKKQVWENAMRKQTPGSHPHQVLPLTQGAMQRSKCNALPFTQVVFRRNCTPLRVPNKFCFGQCNSFYLPGWPSGVAQPCTSCSPTRSRNITVPLQCENDLLYWEEVVLVEECDCENRYEGEVGSGEGFLPVS